LLPSLKQHSVSYPITDLNSHYIYEYIWGFTAKLQSAFKASHKHEKTRYFLYISVVLY